MYAGLHAMMHDGSAHAGSLPGEFEVGDLLE
jgi:hypothetical protein